MTVRYAARTQQQLEERRLAKKAVDAWSTMLVANYATDPAIIAAVLPPPLSPSEDPLVKVTIASVDIPGYGSFGAGSFSVQCRHRDTLGYYCLVMVMTTEQPVITGRETYGEPKKIGQVHVALDGDQVTASMGRMGVTWVEFNGRTTGDLPVPPVTTRTDFYVKPFPAPDGEGLDHDPALVYCTREETTQWAKACEGTLTLRESRFDPVADLPVRSLIDVSVGYRNAIQKGRIVEYLPQDLILPYLHQRYDDFPAADEA
jgi:acetoacetate decarboxylase